MTNDTRYAKFDGHMVMLGFGSIGQAVLPLVPVAIVCPVGLFNVDGICRFPLACPPGTEFANGCCVYRGCPPSYVRIRGLGPLPRAAGQDFMSRVLPAALTGSASLRGSGLGAAHGSGAAAGERSPGAAPPGCAEDILVLF